MRSFRKLTKTLNRTFTAIVLFLFYFTGIGLGAIMRRIFRHDRPRQSYWLKAPADGFESGLPY